MRIWGGVLVVVCLACGDDDGGIDAATDSAIDSAIDASSDSGPLLCEAAEPGCTGACQIVHDCVVESTQRDLLIGLLAGLGFRERDWDDCSECIANCESDTTSGGDTARACFQSQFEMATCTASSDPTVAANAINTCCEGRGDSPFCIQTCLSIVNAGLDLLLDLIPNCEALAENTLTEPTCHGACPVVLDAIHIPVDNDADWLPRTYDVHTDGSIAVHGGTDAGTIDFGAGVTLTVDTTTQFVVVFDADGTARWVRRLGNVGGLADIFGRLVAFDGSGNVVAASELRGSVDLGSGELTSSGSDDVLVAKWSADGTLIFARAFGSSEIDLPKMVAVQGDDTLIAVDHFGTIDLGLGEHTAQGADILIARLDATGTPLWSRSYGGDGDEAVWGIAAHPSGDYTLVGGVSTGADLGAGTITSAGDQDGFTARFGDDGTLRWAHVGGGADWDIGYQIDTHAEDVVVGHFITEGTVDFSGTLVTGVNQPLMRYDETGELSWLNDNPQTRLESGFALSHLSVSADGSVTVAAQTATPVANLGGGDHEASRSTDTLVGSFAPDGSFRWSVRLGGPLREGNAYIERLPSGEAILVGRMVDQLDWGDGDFIGEGLDLFVLRFAAD